MRDDPIRMRSDVRGQSAEQPWAFCKNGGGQVVVAKSMVGAQGVLY